MPASRAAHVDFAIDEIPVCQKQTHSPKPFLFAFRLILLSYFPFCPPFSFFFSFPNINPDSLYSSSSPNAICAGGVARQSCEHWANRSKRRLFRRLHREQSLLANARYRILDNATQRKIVAKLLCNTFLPSIQTRKKNGACGPGRQLPACTLCGGYTAHKEFWNQYGCLPSDASCAVGGGGGCAPEKGSVSPVF